MGEISINILRPLSCIYSVSKHVFPLDNEWDKSTYKDTVLLLYRTTRLLCGLNYTIAGLLVVNFKLLLVREL